LTPNHNVKQNNYCKVAQRSDQGHPDRTGTNPEVQLDQNENLTRALTAVSYAASKWDPKTLMFYLSHLGIMVSMPSGEPITEGHNFNVTFEHHWAAGVNRLEKLDEMQKEWNIRVWEQVRKPFLEYFQKQIQNKNKDEIDYWTNTYSFLVSGSFI
jgi:hypothetical protein